jgi:peroxiredoxin
MLVVVPWVLAVSATALAVRLSARYHKLTDEIVEHRRNDQHVRRGDYIPTFLAQSTAGLPLTVGSMPDTMGRQVLFFLTSTCPYCKATLPAWAAITGKLSRSPNRLQVIGVTSDSDSLASRFSDSAHLSFPLVSFGSRKLMKLAHGGNVPQTIVIDSDGRVLYSRSGAITTQPAIDSVLFAATAPLPAAKRLPSLVGTAKVLTVPASN